MSFSIFLLQGFVFDRRMYFVEGTLVCYTLSWAHLPVLTEEVPNGYLSGNVVSSAVSTVQALL